MSESSPKLPHFTLASILLSMSFIGAGIACFCAGYLFRNDANANSLTALQTFSSGPLIGAGMLAPFRRARLGAYAGFFAIVAVALGYDTYRFNLDWALMPSALLLAVAIWSFGALVGAIAMCYRIARRRASPPISLNPIAAWMIFGAAAVFTIAIVANLHLQLEP
ncbi:MAG TPA: hypothetical protein VL175_19840 [Pirellulales bacterium]|nr:hypothetical protein [Pirellulales bacterium]